MVQGDRVKWGWTSQSRIRMAPVWTEDGPAGSRHAAPTGGGETPKLRCNYCAQPYTSKQLGAKLTVQLVQPPILEVHGACPEELRLLPPLRTVQCDSMNIEARRVTAARCSNRIDNAGQTHDHNSSHDETSQLQPPLTSKAAPRRSQSKDTKRDNNKHTPRHACGHLLPRPRSNVYDKIEFGGPSECREKAPARHGDAYYAA